MTVRQKMSGAGALRRIQRHAGPEGGVKKCLTLAPKSSKVRTTKQREDLILCAETSVMDTAITAITLAVILPAHNRFARERSSYLI